MLELGKLLRATKTPQAEYTQWERLNLATIKGCGADSASQLVQLALLCSKAPSLTRNISRAASRALRLGMHTLQPQEVVDCILSQANARVLHLATLDAAAVSLLQQLENHGTWSMQLHHVARWYKAHNLAGTPMAPLISHNMLAIAAAELSHVCCASSAAAALLPAAALARHCAALGEFSSELSMQMAQLLRLCVKHRVWAQQGASSSPPQRQSAAKQAHAASSIAEYLAMHYCPSPAAYVQPHMVGIARSVPPTGAHATPAVGAVSPHPARYTMLPPVQLAAAAAVAETDSPAQHRVHPVVSGHRPLPDAGRELCLQAVKLAAAALTTSSGASADALTQTDRTLITARCVRALALCGSFDATSVAGARLLKVAGGASSKEQNAWASVPQTRQGMPAVTQAYMQTLQCELQSHLSEHEEVLSSRHAAPPLPCPVDAWLPNLRTAILLDGPDAFTCSMYASLLTSCWTAAAVSQRALPTMQLLEYMDTNEVHGGAISEDDDARRQQGQYDESADSYSTVWASAVARRQHSPVWQRQTPLSVAFSSWDAVLRGGVEQIIGEGGSSTGVPCEYQPLGVPPQLVGLPLHDQIRALSRFCRVASDATGGGGHVPYEALLTSIGMQFNPHAFMRHSFSGLLVKPLGGGSRQPQGGGHTPGPYLRGLFPLTLSSTSLLQQQLLLAHGARVLRVPAWVWAARVASGQDASRSFVWSALLPLAEAQGGAIATDTATWGNAL